MDVPTDTTCEGTSLVVSLYKTYRCWQVKSAGLCQFHCDIIISGHIYECIKDPVNQAGHLSYIASIATDVFRAERDSAARKIHFDGAKVCQGRKPQQRKG